MIKEKKKGFKNLCLSISAAILVLPGILCFPVMAMAGGNISEESCEDVGLIDVECYVCETGEYKGKVTVEALYDARFDGCMGNYKDARQKCADIYGDGNKQDFGMKWSYWINWTKFSNQYPKDCEY